MSRQLELRNILQAATLDDEWSQFINEENTATIQNFEYWRKLLKIRDDGSIFHTTIKQFQGVLSYTNTILH